MKIKYKFDARHKKQWEEVKQMEFGWSDKSKPIVFTVKFGWVLLENCEVKEGNFNTKNER